MVSVWQGLTPEPLYCSTIYLPQAGRNLKIALFHIGSKHFRPAVRGNTRATHE